ncbi:MAG: O-antigen ligase [Paludibacter sp.]|jgi:oligosaccharide repeat unit polymerase|nr:O-antigen ligase [Paludibacter sp.]
MWLVLSYSVLFISLLVSYFTIDFAVADVFTNAVILSLVFIVSSVAFLRSRRKNFFLSFELFFFIIFFLVTYTFPLMAINEDDLLLLVDISPYLINKSLYLSTIGFVSYLLGASLMSHPFREESRELSYDLDQFDFTRLAYLFNRITVVFVVLFFLVDGATFVVRYSNETTEVSGGYVLPYVRVLAIISTVIEFSRLAQMKCDSLKLTLKNISVFYLLNMSLLMPFFLIIGYRSEFLVLALTVFVVYALLIKPINKGLVFALVFAGFWVMSLMKYFRGFNDVDVNELQGDGAFTLIGLFSEFYIPSSTLYEFVQYVEANGPTYGSNILLHVLAFIPFLQSVVVRLFGLDVTSSEYLTSSDFISNYILGEDRSWGLGTHVIGDLYYTFGFPGVIILMFLMGLLVSFMTERIIYRKQFKLILMMFFVVAISQSFFFSRVEYFRPIRDLGLLFWVMIIVKYAVGFRYRVGQPAKKEADE